MNIEHYNTG